MSKAKTTSATRSRAKAAAKPAAKPRTRAGATATKTRATATKTRATATKTRATATKTRATATKTKAAPTKAAPTKTASTKTAPTKTAPTKTAPSKAAATKAKAAAPKSRAPKPAAKQRATARPAATRAPARKIATAKAAPSPEAAAGPPAASPAESAGELRFQASDGVSLSYRVWRPDGKPQRLLILVHGFADHSGRFSYLAPHLVEHGAVVYAYDQRGNGLSEGKKGHVQHYQRLVDDLDAFVKLATEKEPGLPRVLYAHSTGAIAALTYLYDSPDAVDAVVLSAPCLILTVDAPGWKTTVAKALSNVVPGFTMQAGFDPGTVSRDGEVVEANKADPLVSQNMTARFYTEVYLTAMPSALARIDELRTPYLVLQGTGDKLVSPGVADEFERQAAEYGTIKRYEGGYHESHNDVHREEVFADVDAWLKAGAKPKRSRG